MPRAATKVKIGPQHDGRRMSLKRFEHAIGQEGYLYELGRGVITVMRVPRPEHACQVHAAHRQFSSYDLAHPGAIKLIAAGSDCKILLATLQSERHPDLAIYMTAPPEDGDDVWGRWIPEIVIEIVSARSRRRDYYEKPEEYLMFGVLEYWILDADRAQLWVLMRAAGQWRKRVVRPPHIYQTPHLPGLRFSCAQVFEAAKKAK